MRFRDENGSLAGEVSVSGECTDWTPEAAGVYTVTAEAWDEDGNPLPDVKVYLSTDTVTVNPASDSAEEPDEA